MLAYLSPKALADILLAMVFNLGEDVRLEKAKRIGPILIPWTVQRLGHIPHELWQIRVPQHLSDGVGLAQVRPVMIDISQEHRASALDARLTLPLQMGLLQLGSEHVKAPAGGLSDLTPHGPHLIQWRRARRLSVPHKLVQIGR
jgi:hypothetical protein